MISIVTIISILTGIAVIIELILVVALHRFGSSTCAQEELVAELGLTLDRVRIPLYGELA